MGTAARPAAAASAKTGMILPTGRSVSRAAPRVLITASPCLRKSAARPASRTHATEVAIGQAFRPERGQEGDRQISGHNATNRSKLTIMYEYKLIEISSLEQYMCHITTVSFCLKS